MTELRSSIGAAANTVGKIHESGIMEEKGTPWISKPIEKNDKPQWFNRTDLQWNSTQSGIVYKFDPFINEIVFNGDHVRLRLIGSDFILEKYKVGSEFSLDETIKYNWTNQSTQKEWNKMSVKVREMIAKGNPTFSSDSEEPRISGDSESTYAIVIFPNGAIRFWKRDEESFDFELRFGFKAYCYGTCNKDDMDELRNSYLIIFNSISHNGKKLDIQEQRQVIAPQEDYVSGDDCVITIQVGGN